MKNNFIVKNTIQLNQKKEYSIDYKKILGFWFYLMSDCIIFATLFAVYAVMVNNVALGPSGVEIFKLPLVVLETIILLISSFTYGIFLVFIIKKKKNILLFLFLTFFLGIVFCGLELYEFYTLIQENYGPYTSGFLSAFFALIGMHGIHVIVGLVWILVMVYQILFFGINKLIFGRLMCLGLFWHFLDILWIFIFTFVYLFGVL
ncbi:cytochrome o ubiquinol oxidase subunit III [Buchnera aphidicola (Mollitrichosiphum nigrofasciatum)]|uniref:cytochrome o ubiquinol oxidase subunit III n=1 Tax=Buchnera aphidicola TaxID=9 RepID=UPI0031B81D86